MPNLNYGSPLEVFTTNKSYTCVKECYLLGVLGNQSSATTAKTLTINNTKLLNLQAARVDFVPLLKLKIGDVVEVSGGTNHSQTTLAIYEPIIN